MTAIELEAADRAATGSVRRRSAASSSGSSSPAAATVLVHRSEITIDLGALRRNVRALLAQLDGAQLWAVVKADGYGHGAADVAGAALGASAAALCSSHGGGGARASARVHDGADHRHGAGDES